MESKLEADKMEYKRFVSRIRSSNAAEAGGAASQSDWRGSFGLGFVSGFSGLCKGCGDTVSGLLIGWKSIAAVLMAATAAFWAADLPMSM